VLTIYLPTSRKLHSHPRCVKLALVHDVAEAIVGDIAPCDGVPKEEKSRLEAAAMQTIKNMLGEHTAAGSLGCC
jgi:5'-deoxynucleotidase YfbR-like HD superfamily hydrolase